MSKLSIEKLLEIDKFMDNVKEFHCYTEEFITFLNLSDTESEIVKKGLSIIDNKIKDYDKVKKEKDLKNIVRIKKFKKEDDN